LPRSRYDGFLAGKQEAGNSNCTTTQPRVVLRFAAEKELLLSGMITGGNEIAEKPAVVDVPHGKGHVVLFANNPMWRNETMGSFFLVFNAIMNYDHLNAGRTLDSRGKAESSQPGDE
jgi:hypothetical protein